MDKLQRYDLVGWYELYMDKQEYGDWVYGDDAEARIAELEIELATANSLLINVYNSGYMGGHHDTVEAVFVDIHQSDMDTYHEEVVMELVDDLIGRNGGE